MDFVFMCDRKVLAKPERVGEETIYKLTGEVSDDHIPPGLFRNGITETSQKVTEWFCTRVFPENRVGSEQLLDELELDKYDPWYIVKKTNGCLMEDPWWLKIRDTDSYETSTVRGAAEAKGYKL